MELSKLDLFELRPLVQKFIGDTKMSKNQMIIYIVEDKFPSKRGKSMTSEMIRTIKTEEKRRQKIVSFNH